MPVAPFSTSHLDYLRRAGVNLAGLSVGGPSTTAPPDRRRLWRVRSIGRADKQLKPSRGRLEQSAGDDLLIGLSGASIPMAFFVNGTPSGIAIYVGTWSHPNTVREPLQFTDLDHSESVLKASMHSLYSAIEMTAARDEVTRLPVSGLVLGVPTAKPANAYDGALPIDRLIRALSGSTWAALIQAAPVTEDTIISCRDAIINELGSVQTATQGEKVEPPLAKTYTDWLTFTLKSLNSSLEVGLWRTGVYLLGDEESYGRLAGVWRAIFSGEKSLPEPIRVLKKPEVVGELATKWILPDAPGAAGPGHYRHTFQYQTLLTSSQLAAYVHLPQLETAGFAISKVIDFDTVQQAKDEGASIQIGTIVPRGMMFDRDPLKAEPASTNYYEVELDALTKHVFIPGVTGAGKTTTIFHLLRQAWAANIPFLVIEPAKTEYRELRNYPEFGERLRVFTLGDENCSPIRLNPFELLEGAPLSLHIDLLRSVFTHSFGLWNPLPQILEQCLYLIYEDKGWDVTSGVNHRTADRTDPIAFPTLSDLEHKTLEVTQRLQWDPEAKARIRGALVDKLSGLRHGARGRMLDGARSIPMIELMENPTVLELERLGDEDDKAFLMGLFLIRLCEYRRAQDNPHDGESSLKHLFVFEEAHRLLANVPAAQRQEETDARAKAVEGFTNLLSEIRAYGQGVIIADQVPTKLAPDVIKNTNLKIAHRIVDAEDRNVLAGSMAMTVEQASALAVLGLGTTVVFREGEDAPLLVHVPPPGDRAKAPEKTVQQQMAGFRRNYQELFLRHPGCADTGERGGAACEAAQALVESPAFRQNLNRLVLSILADDSAGDRLFKPIEQSINSSLPNQADRAVMLQCAIARAADYYASRRGSQAGWSYESTSRFAQWLRLFLLDLARKAPTTKESLTRLRELYLDLNDMPVPYYSRCEKICDSKPSRCLYRHAVSDVVDGGAFTRMWNGSDPFNPAKADATWAVCCRVANMLVENNANQAVAFRRSGLCYGQMMLAANGVEILPEARDRLLDILCEQAKA
jgi:Helicase HerA, central domain